ncbi:SGNH/GDSL hydrolase family protein [Streptomyces sp. NPDC060223]|uniref:SGNH/GDSL hydrolase family protein n=1 Tax=unclassified Streptomyces TaxID=2593676 RepID=UPI00363BE7DC
MRAASFGRLATGAVSALIMAVCIPLGSASATQPQAPTVTTATPAAAKGKHSVVTWGASADRQSEGPADRSYRLIVRTSVGGSNMRIRLSNAFGENPVTFTTAYAGLQKQGAELVRGSNRKLSFGGAASVTAPAGETVLSDPLPGKLAAQSNLVISLYVTGAKGPTTGHGMAMQTNYATAGNHAAEEGAASWTDPMGSWYWLDAVNVETSTSIGSLVALGDSITDGWQSSTDLNRRWPDYLSRRLQEADTPVKGVANEGISGNKVLADGAGQSALNRLQRDVLSQPGVRTVFLFEGVNDIKAHSGVTAQDMIDGYRKIIDQAHAAGKCVVGSTIAPFKGWYEWDVAAESVRLEINEFVRNSGELDAVTDFDKILRSPYDHERISPFFDNGDHLHPNDVGMGAMADAVDIGSLTSC